MPTHRTLLSLLVVGTALGALSVGLSGRGQEGGAVPFEVEVVASGLEVPWDLAFAPDGTLYFTERVGRVSRLEDGAITVLAAPESFADLRVEGEAGLMGMALDPDFPEAPYLYLCYSYWGEEEAERVKVARLTLESAELRREQTLVDDIASDSVHNGCRLVFGPDGMLYVSTGDGSREEGVQDPERLNGKILRLEPDGGIPEDNPYGNAVWTLGHRNPQGLAFHSGSGRLYSTEHGPDRDDEINLIARGQNYGWPEVTGTEGAGPYTPALIAYTPPLAVAGLDDYQGELFPEWQGDLIFVSLRAGELHRLALGGDGRVIGDERLIGGQYGRLRAVAVSPEGAIYLATSNRDGRNPTPDPEDDRILLLRPMSE